MSFRFDSVVSPIRTFLLTCILTLASSEGQIFADFTLSTGTGAEQSPLGSFRVRLEHEKAPRPVANFIGLATGERPWFDPVTGAIRRDRYYDGQIFHRLVHDFVLQGGDILGTGAGGPGFVIQDQFDASLRHSGRYFLSMARGSFPHSNGSQFFITLEARPLLDDRHSIFGEVISGREIIDGFTDASLFPTDSGERPLTAINLDSVVISGPDLADFDLFDPELRLPTIRPDSTTARVTRREGQVELALETPVLEAQTLYQLSGGNDFASFRTLTRLFSADELSQVSILVPQTSEPRFFARIAAVDYGLLRNPPLNLAAANRQFVMRDRADGELTLAFLNESSGEWSHSDGGSGDFSFEAGSVGFPLSGVFVLSSSGTSAIEASQIPLSSFRVVFDGPVGPAGWRDLDLVASFHEESSGFVEGSALIETEADGVGVRTPVRDRFLYIE